MVRQGRPGTTPSTVWLAETQAERRAEAARLLATLVGAVLLAGAVDCPDLAPEVLGAAAREMTAKGSD